MAGRFTHFLVPTDFSPASDAAVACAKEMARAFNARLTLLHVVTDPRASGAWAPDVYVPASPEMRARFLQQAREQLQATLTAEEQTQFSVTIEARIGAPAEVIRELADEQKVDLIVMGTHGRRGLSHMFLGSVAERMVRNAPCPVLTTHANTQPEAKSEPAA
jgi:nucleotide-binding universal stress UspA family protein